MKKTIRPYTVRKKYIAPNMKAKTSASWTP